MAIGAENWPADALIRHGEVVKMWLAEQDNNERLQAENERLHGVLEDVYAYLRTIDYRADVFEQVAPLERVLREALGK